MPKENFPVSQRDALRRAEPGHLRVLPTKHDLEGAVQLSEAKKIFAEVGPQFLTPQEMQVASLLLNDTKIRRTIAKELGMSLNEVMQLEASAFLKMQQEFPARLGIQEWQRFVTARKKRAS